MTAAAPAAVGRLRSLPRRRRPGMVALALALVGAGVLASAALYQRADHRAPVLLVTAPVPAGVPLTAADLGVTSITAGSGVSDIPARQVSQVVGLIAATALRPGTLLAASELTTRQSPSPGQYLVPLAVRPSMLPAGGLAPGDSVLVVATPGDQGQGGSAGAAAVLRRPVPGVVEAVGGAAVGQDGLDVVNLLVSARAGPGLAKQASTGQFALIVTHRGAGGPAAPAGPAGPAG